MRRVHLHSNEIHDAVHIVHSLCLRLLLVLLSLHTIRLIYFNLELVQGLHRGEFPEVKELKVRSRVQYMCVSINSTNMQAYFEDVFSIARLL